MCGRTSLFASPDELESRFDVTVPEAYTPRYNIAPTDPLEVITGNEQRSIQRFRWGLLPHWADDPAEGFINARSETVDEKPAFRDAWESRPCLVLSSGFYDWKPKPTDRGSKQPYRFYRDGDAVFAMAGLWEHWTGTEADINTVTILTTEPNDTVEPIHHRMPVILPEDEEMTWLTAGPDERKELCRPYPDDDLNADPISTAVNDPSNDSPAIIEPDESEQTGLDEFI